jgi:hypothetical protein
MISRQRSEEVALFQEELCDGSLSFCNFMAKVLLELPDDALASMPEDFVSDCCKVLEWSSTRALVFAVVLPKPHAPSPMACTEYDNVYRSL